MKKLSISALALIAALVAAPMAAHAGTTPGWYVGAGAGGTFGIDPISHSAAGKYSARDEDVNLAVFGDVGYALGNGVRVEGEYFHNQINVNNIDGRRGVGGHVTNHTAFGNVLYDFAPEGRFTPYVGAGLGADFVNVKSIGATGVGYLKGDTLVLGYQGIAGVSANLDPNWTVTADYRYIGSFDPKVDSTAGGQGRIENASNNVMVGLRYNFATPAAAPTPAPVAPLHSSAAPVVAPHAGARPAVAAAPQNFMVFFDFNKSTLTPEAKRIIASAAAEYKRDGYAKISITGHTDTVGSDSYNKKLSDRRALAVEAELTKLGVETGHISEAGVGKEGLMVPTANGVREAQNRRAEIVLSK
jgi:outer membrane protein OmpA-like peptidoglycan-associated protein